MTRRMPRPEDVSREHIDAAVIGFLKGEKDADWTEVSLVTLHPREEIRVVLRENLERYRTVNKGRFLQLLARLRSQGVTLHLGYKYPSGECEIRGRIPALEWVFGKTYGQHS